MVLHHGAHLGVVVGAAEERLQIAAQGPAGNEAAIAPERQVMAVPGSILGLLPWLELPEGDDVRSSGFLAGVELLPGLDLSGWRGLDGLAHRKQQHHAPDDG